MGVQVAWPMVCNPMLTASSLRVNCCADAAVNIVNELIKKTMQSKR
jgi:hypothetical protein